MIPRTLLVAIMVATLLLVGCASDISSVKNEERIGDTVTVRGTVENTLKIGELSGFTIADETGSIMVSSDSLPAEGDTITIRGTLMRDSLLGWYIQRK